MYLEFISEIEVPISGAICEAILPVLMKSIQRASWYGNKMIELYPESKAMVENELHDFITNIESKLTND